MIVDMMRIPTDKYGDLLYDIDEVRVMFEQYLKLFPEHQVFAIPDKIKIWEDLDIETLENMSQYLEKII